MKSKRTIYRAVAGDSGNQWTKYEDMAQKLGSTKENMCQIANKGLLRIAKDLIKITGSNADPRQIAASEAFQDLVAQSLKMRKFNVL